jgi:ubiquinone/menaquinone biosynthesis C-methylase UbiE
MTQAPVYSSSVFDVSSIPEAMAIILTPEGGSTDERWAKETPWAVNRLLETAGELGPDSVVLDYGCGIGRIARELILSTGCRVVGADISPSMRALAHAYVASDRFLSCHPDFLPALGISFDAAYAVWVLQHCLRPEDDLARIGGVMKPGAGLFVMNNQHRAVPTLDRQWANDGKDVRQLIGEAGFAARDSGELPAAICPPSVHQLTYWGWWRKAA